MSDELIDALRLVDPETGQEREFVFGGFVALPTGTFIVVVQPDSITEDSAVCAVYKLVDPTPQEEDEVIAAWAAPEDDDG